MIDLEGRLFVTGKDDFEFRVARGVGQTLVPDNNTIADITDTIQANEIDVFIPDPLVALHSVNENTPGAMSDVIHIFGGIAMACHCAIDLCHHTRKPSNNGDGEKEFTSDDSRGTGSIRAAARGTRVLNRMNRTEAGNVGISEEERPFFIRLDKGKANYLPPAQKARWFRLRDVELLNGDHVGAIEPYVYPGQDSAPTPEKEAADRRAEGVFLAILRRFNTADLPASPLRNSIHYAPARFAEAREARLAKLGRFQLAEAMQRLLDRGAIMPKTHGRGGRKTTLVPT
jgi:hypothetical protein